MVAVQEFHKLRLAHLDIQLPNLCFNEEFEVVINIDFSSYINVGIRAASPSCLYRIPETLQKTFYSLDLKGQKIDYMQVGWMIAYIIDSIVHPSKDVQNFDRLYIFCQ